MTGKDVLNSLIGGSGSKQKGNAEYARGYADCEKKYKQYKAERDAAIGQLRKLGYTLGEPPDALKSAAIVKRECRSRGGGCAGCDFESREGCALRGESPSEWRIM